MKIEKVKNYNQKLLALIGTVVLALAVIGLISTIVFVFSEIFGRSRYEYQQQGILAEEKVEELAQENKRKQIISYTLPRLVDTLNSIYIIPVSHRTLNETEDIDEGVLGIMDAKVSSGYGKRYSKSYQGVFNNLLIYDSKAEITERLFSTRVNLGTIRTEYFDDEILLLFEAADKDSNKDGIINLEDLKSLYYYSLIEKKLNKIGLPGSDINNYKFDNMSKDLIIRFGIDYDESGEFEAYREPSTLRKYIYKTGELIQIVDDANHNELQKILEGTNN